MGHRRIILALAVAVLAVATIYLAARYSMPAAAAEPPVFTGLVRGIAVSGYDPVAYFTQGKPVKGLDNVSLEYEGATWRFASEKNRAAFRAEPKSYAPQYGGYCAYAVSQGYTAKAEPDAWTIYDGKLYLNYDKRVQADWEKDIPGYVAKADANWPGVLER